MTSSKQVAGATQQAAGQTASTAKDEAAQVGQTATAAASDVAGTAKQQSGRVAGEAADQARQLADQAKEQVSQQAHSATQKLSDTVRSLSTEVRDMSQGKAEPSGTVAGLAQQLADKGEQLADFITSQGPGGLVQELRVFAARRPGTFLLGALAAGVATGRVVKGASAASSASSTSGTSSVSPMPAPVPLTSGPPYTTAYGMDVAPIASVPTAPVPVVMSDDSGILDGQTEVIGPVSGDQRLIDERLAGDPRDPGTGLR